MNKHKNLKIMLSIGEPRNLKRRNGEEDPDDDYSDLTLERGGGGMSDKKKADYALGKEHEPSKLRESDTEEPAYPSTPGKEDFESDRQLQKRALLRLKNRPLRR